MTRPRVLLVSQIPMWSMAPGTGGPAFDRTVRALADRFDLTVVTPEVAHIPDGAFPAGVTVETFAHRFHGTCRGVRKVGWVFDTAGWHAFTSAAWPIVRRHCEDGVDLVYGYEVYGVPVARRAADAFAVPMVARYQGSLLGERQHMALARLRFLKHFRALETPADLYVMTDDGTGGDRLLDALGAPPEKVRFWRNGVDRELLDHAPRRPAARTVLGLDPDTPVLLTVSRLMGWKRVDRAIDVAAALARRGLRTQLVVVGTGDREAELKAHAARMLEPDTYRFVGGVKRDVLASYYRSADLLLSLYDYSNLANPVLESMLLGTPVVALATGDTHRLMVPDVNGVLVDDPDPDVVGVVIEGLLDDGTEQLSLSTASWADEHLWTWEERMRAETDELAALIEARGTE